MSSTTSTTEIHENGEIVVHCPWYRPTPFCDAIVYTLRQVHATLTPKPPLWDLPNTDNAVKTMKIKLDFEKMLKNLRTATTGNKIKFNHNITKSQFTHPDVNLLHKNTKRPAFDVEIKKYKSGDTTFVKKIWTQRSTSLPSQPDKVEKETTNIYQEVAITYILHNCLYSHHSYNMFIKPFNFVKTKKDNKPVMSLSLDYIKYNETKGHITLNRWLRSSFFNADHLKMIVFQVLYALSVCQSILPFFRHLDLHTGNIMLIPHRPGEAIVLDMRHLNTDASVPKLFDNVVKPLVILRGCLYRCKIIDFGLTESKIFHRDQNHDWMDRHRRLSQYVDVNRLFNDIASTLDQGRKKTFTEQLKGLLELCLVKNKYKVNKTNHQFGCFISVYEKKRHRKISINQKWESFAQGATPRDNDFPSIKTILNYLVHNHDQIQSAVDIHFRPFLSMDELHYLMRRTWTFTDWQRSVPAPTFGDQIIYTRSVPLKDFMPLYTGKQSGHWVLALIQEKLHLTNVPIVSTITRRSNGTLIVKGYKRQKYTTVEDQIKQQVNKKKSKDTIRAQLYRTAMNIIRTLKRIHAVMPSFRHNAMTASNIVDASDHSGLQHLINFEHATCQYDLRDTQDQTAIDREPYRFLSRFLDVRQMMVSFQQLITTHELTIDTGTTDRLQVLLTVVFGNNRAHFDTSSHAFLKTENNTLKIWNANAKEYQKLKGDATCFKHTFWTPSMLWNYFNSEHFQEKMSVLKKR